MPAILIVLATAGAIAIMYGIYVVGVRVYDGVTGKPVFSATGPTISPSLQQAIQNLTPTQQDQIIQESVKAQTPSGSIQGTINSALIFVIVGFAIYVIIETGLLKVFNFTKTKS